METIKDTVHSLMQGLKAGGVVSGEAKIEGLLKKLLTKKELKHIKLNYFKKGRLGIKVDSSGWLYQLSLQKEGLLEALRKESAEISDIRFSIGEINGQRKRKTSR